MAELCRLTAEYKEKSRAASDERTQQQGPLRARVQGARTVEVENVCGPQTARGYGGRIGEVVLPSAPARPGITPQPTLRAAGRNTRNTLKKKGRDQNRIKTPTPRMPTHSMGRAC